MEILRNIEYTIGDKLEKLGKKILFVTIVKELGVTDMSIKKMGTKKFIEEKYNPYFDKLMDLYPNERHKFIEEKLSHIPEKRREHARKFIYEGIRDFIKREKEKVS